MSEPSLEAGSEIKKKEKPTLFTLMCIAAAVVALIITMVNGYKIQSELKNGTVTNQSINQMLTTQYGKVFEIASIKQIEFTKPEKIYLNSKAKITHFDKSLPNLSVIRNDIFSKGDSGGLHLKLEDIHEKEVGEFVAYSITDVLEKIDAIDESVITYKPDHTIEARFPKEMIYKLSTEETKVILSTFIDSLIKEKLIKANSWQVIETSNLPIAGGRN